MSWNALGASQVVHDISTFLELLLIALLALAVFLLDILAGGCMRGLDGNFNLILSQNYKIVLIPMW